MRKNIYSQMSSELQRIIFDKNWETAWNTFYDDQYLHDGDSLLCTSFQDYYIDISFYLKLKNKVNYFKIEVCDKRKYEDGWEFIFEKEASNLSNLEADFNYYSQQIPVFERTEKMSLNIPATWRVSWNILNDKMLRDHQESLFLAVNQGIFVDITCNLHANQLGIAQYNLSVTRPLSDTDFNSELLFETIVDDYFMLETELNFWLNKFQ